MRRVLLSFFVVLFMGTFLMLGGISNADEMEAPNVYFSDVEEGIWYEETLAIVLEENIIDGYPDGTFKGGNEMQRDQFIKTMVVAIDGEQELSDTYWASHYIDRAIELGIISEGQFDDYTQVITRAEMAQVAENTLVELEGEYEYKYLGLIEGEVSDIDEVDATDVDSVLKMYEQGVLKGYPDGAYKPNDGLKRQEAITVILRVIDDDYRDGYVASNIVKGVDISQYSEEVQGYIEVTGILPYEGKDGEVYSEPGYGTTYYQLCYGITVFTENENSTDGEYPFGMSINLYSIYHEDEEVSEIYTKYVKYMIREHLNDFTNIDESEISVILDRFDYRYEAYAKWEESASSEDTWNEFYLENTIVYDNYNRQIAVREKGLSASNTIFSISGLFYDRF